MASPGPFIGKSLTLLYPVASTQGLCSSSFAKLSPLNFPPDIKFPQVSLVIETSFPRSLNMILSGLSKESCCRGYTYSPLQKVHNGNQCFCGFDLGPSGVGGLVPVSGGCHIICFGSIFQDCGGTTTMVLYDNSANSNHYPPPRNLFLWIRLLSMAMACYFSFRAASSLTPLPGRLSFQIPRYFWRSARRLARAPTNS